MYYESDFDYALRLQSKMEMEEKRSRVNNDRKYFKLLQEQIEKEECKKRKFEEKIEDHHYAELLQKQFEEEEKFEKDSKSLSYDYKANFKSIVDPSWELIDPTPDIHNLFVIFNTKFFWNTLLPVSVSWSKKMKLCAGVCTYHPRGRFCHITLSEPLLKLRPRKDLIETLLHEMIHAHLFVTGGDTDREGHGPKFHMHMYRINKEAGTNITVYHNFHDEVKLYQQHWWQCDGPCKFWKPYNGLVKRSINRPPGPNDNWWGQHQRECGGIFHKIKEPAPKGKYKKEKEKFKNPVADIKQFLKKTSGVKKKNETSTTSKLSVKANEGNLLKSENKENNLEYEKVREHWLNKYDKIGTEKSNINKVECPSCLKLIFERNVNEHLDSCLKTKNCLICNEIFPEDFFSAHQAECVEKMFTDVVFECKNCGLIELLDSSNDRHICSM